MGRTSDIIRFRVKESEVQMWVFPRVPWQVLFFFFYRTGWKFRSSDSLFRVSPRHSSFLGSRAGWGQGCGDGDGGSRIWLMLPEPAFLLPQLTIFSNTKEAWEWHRHLPDQYNKFSISAYIMGLYMKQPSFSLSQFMSAVHSQPVLLLQGKRKILHSKKIMKIQNEIATRST